MKVEQSNTESVLRIDDVKARVGLSRSAIYDKINPTSQWYDPTFPKQISLGFRSVGWLESEISAWIQQRISVSRGAA